MTSPFAVEALSLRLRSRLGLLHLSSNLLAILLEVPLLPFAIGMLLARDSIVGISIPSSISLPASLITRSVMHHPATNSLVTLLARLIVMMHYRVGPEIPLRHTE